MPPTAVVFDFNGTISHDEPLLAVLFREMFAEIGIDVTESLYFEEFAGYSDPEIVDRVLARFGRGGEPETAKRLVARRIELYLAAVAEHSPVQPGAAAAVREIAARVPVAIASGASRPEIEAVLKATGLRTLFEVIVTAEDISNSKPHPEGYRIALEQLDVPGAGALAFEDSDLGVTAAISAGMRCVAIEGTSPPDRLRAAGAEDVIPALDWSLPAVSGLFATP
ncbi:MAG: HAD family hydrolase [Gaiellales bacterium]